MRMHVVCLLMTGFVATTRFCLAQDVTVQQPVVRNFSAATTISVPDRGRAFIGGVSRGASSSQRGGFSPFGSSQGREHSAGSMSVTATIHDFAEYDRLALESAPSSADDSRDPLARHAGESLLRRQSGLSTKSTVATVGDPAAKAARFTQLGEAAAARGDTRLAAQHFRMAAKYGAPSPSRRETAVATNRPARNPTRQAEKIAK